MNKQFKYLLKKPMGYKDSMNLYQAFNMNGFNYVDPMGRTIIVEKSFRKDWKRIKNYLTSNSDLARTVIKFLELPKFKIYLYDLPNEQAYAYLEKARVNLLIYDEKTKAKYSGKDVVLIDSKTVIRVFDEKTFKEIGYQSVALSLMHELLHAFHEKTINELYSTGLAKEYSPSSPFYKWHNPEEKRTVAQESIIANDLGEVVRTYYKLLDKNNKIIKNTPEEAFITVNGVLEHKNLK